MPFLRPISGAVPVQRAIALHWLCGFPRRPAFSRPHPAHLREWPSTCSLVWTCTGAKQPSTTLALMRRRLASAVSSASPSMIRAGGISAPREMRGYPGGGSACFTKGFLQLSRPRCGRRQFRIEKQKWISVLQSVFKRSLAMLVAERPRQFLAVMLIGPRQCGKPPSLAAWAARISSWKTRTNASAWMPSGAPPWWPPV